MGFELVVGRFIRLEGDWVVLVTVMATRGREVGRILGEVVMGIFIWDFLF